MNLMTRITYTNLADFIADLERCGLKRVFRDYGNSDCAGGNYTAFDDVGKQHFVADVVYPEAVELQRCLNPQYEPGSDRYGRHSGKWSFDGDWCSVSTNSKKEFVDWLKRLKVPEAAIKGLRSTKIADLTTLVDDSNTDDDTDFSITVQEKRGRGETDLAVNLCGGLITKLLMRIQKERHGSSLHYQLIIEDWPSVLKAIRVLNEKPLVDAGIEILAGKIEVLVAKE